MTSLHIRAVALAVAFALSGITAASPARAAPFDGNWSVLIQTTNGHCGVTRWGLAIRRGHVHYAGGYAYGHPVGLSGRVSSSGHIRVNVVAGPRSAHGAGRLGRNQGSGRWAGRGPSGTCSGVWYASRG
jgi:hypothetical protein